MLDWLANVGSISSIIGLIVTLFLFAEARKIKNSFLRRARLPEITRELSKIIPKVSDQLTNWDTDKNPAIEEFSNIRALLENIKPKLPPEEGGKVADYLNRLQPKKYLIRKKPISELDENTAWELYTELSGLVTSLRQLDKDSKWN